MIVRVPASSANLGPGFDSLGMALGIYLEVGFDAESTGGRLLEAGHPAVKAYRSAGGEGELWARCPIPAGRGLGFSGAARIGGLVAALARRAGPDVDLRAHTSDLLHRATELEGHADNVAASLLGGVVATAGGHAVRVPMGFDPVVILWIPSETTSTEEARGRLGRDVGFFDAVFNIGRTALLVAALAAGEVGALETAVQDRLHQETRLAMASGSRAALEAAHDAGAWCGWLSGSGPTVAALCAPDRAEAVAKALPAGGAIKQVRIDHAGAVIESSSV